MAVLINSSVSKTKENDTMCRFIPHRLVICSLACTFQWQDGEIVYTDWRLEKDDSGQVHCECSQSPEIRQGTDRNGFNNHVQITVLKSFELNMFTAGQPF